MKSYKIDPLTRKPQRDKSQNVSNSNAHNVNFDMGVFLCSYVYIV